MPPIVILFTILTISVAVGFVVHAASRIVRARNLANPPLLARPPVSIPQSWPRIDHGYTSVVQKQLDWANAPRERIRYVLIGVAVLCILALVIQALWLAIFAFVAGVGVIVFVVTRANRFRKKFINQIPDALDALAQSLRAGFTMPQSLAIVERETFDPICRVFGALARADVYRVEFTNAIAVLDRTLDCFEWTIVTEAMMLQNRVGGNLISVLGTIADRMRDRGRVEQELQTATASGKFSALIIASLAPLSFALFYFFFPGYLDALLYSTMGNMLLIIALVLEAICFFWIWRLVSFSY